MIDKTVEIIPTDKLDFDPDNPRFYRLNNAHNVEAVIEEMLDDENVQDLMLSIGQKGYFPGEPLLVVKPKEFDGHYIVVEGNRRLAAVKLLNGEIAPPNRRKNSIGEIKNDTVTTPPKELPCLSYDDRRDVLRYLGYRHITGIKQWDSLSKAKYLEQLRNDFYPNLPQQQQMRSLAKEIGSRPDYVAQLLTALELYIKAENAKFFGLPIQAKDIEFSYITTALSYTNICNWLGLESRTDIAMPNLENENLKRIFSWMFAKDQQGRTILGETRNLDEMAAVVFSQEAVKVLEDTHKLSEAYLYTDGPQAALEKAMSEAGVKVLVIWDMLPRIRPLTQSHLHKADALFDDIKSVRTYLRDKLED